MSNFKNAIFIAFLAIIWSTNAMAKVTFLPNVSDDLGFSGSQGIGQDHNSGNSCSDFPLTSCPAGGICSRCSFGAFYKLNNCKSGFIPSGNSCVPGSCSSINTSYQATIPANNICTKTTTSGLTCFKDCRAVSCSGYTLNCDAFNVANSDSKDTCPDCNSADANCSPKLCKVGTCQDGYKLAESATQCVALDDTCSNGYFKTCETGTIGEPQYTELGTACYQCKAKNDTCPVNYNKTCTYGTSEEPKYTEAGNACYLCQTKQGKPIAQIFPILYSDMTTSTEVISGKTPIGVVFNRGKKLALAMQQARKFWSPEEFDIPTVENFVWVSGNLDTDYTGKSKTQKISAYCKSNGKSCPAVEHALSYTTPGTKAGDWFLPAVGELRGWHANVNHITPIMSKIRGNGFTGTSLRGEGYWSSTETSANGAWSTSSASNKTSFEYQVRPVINYNDGTPGSLILYSDMTTSPTIISGKTPIGIVFNEEEKLAIALSESAKLTWSAENFDIPGLNNRATVTDAQIDADGKGNTKIISDYCKTNGKSCPAAEYAVNYTTPGTKAGDWYLPSGYEVRYLFVERDLINEAMKLAKGKELTNREDGITGLWSSTVKDQKNVWRHSFGTGEYFVNDSMRDQAKADLYNVSRPIINYSDIAPVCISEKEVQTELGKRKYIFRTTATANPFCESSWSRPLCEDKTTKIFECTSTPSSGSIEYDSSGNLTTNGAIAWIKSRYCAGANKKSQCLEKYRNIVLNREATTNLSNNIYGENFSKYVYNYSFTDKICDWCLDL